MSASVPDDAVSVAKAFVEAVSFREEFDVVATVATQMTDEARNKLNEVIKTANNSAPEKAAVVATSALENAVAAANRVLEKAQAAKSSIANAQAAAFKVMTTYPGPNDLIVLNRLLIEDTLPEELIPTTFTSGTGTFELMPEDGSLSSNNGKGDINLKFMTLSSGSYASPIGEKSGKVSSQSAITSPPSQSGLAPDDSDMAFTWNMLQTELRTSWICTGNRRILSPIGKFWHYISGSILWQKKDLAMKDRMKRAENIDNAYVVITNLQKQISSGTNTDLFYRYEQLHIALDAFETIALNTTRLTPLPPSLLSKPNDSKPNDSKAPKILSVFPSLVWREINTTYYLLLTNLDQILYVNVAGKHFDYSNSNDTISNRITGMGRFLQVTLPPLFYSATNSTNTLEFVVVGKEGLASKKQPVTLQDKPAEQQEATSKITRDSNGKLTSFTASRSGNDTNVIPVLEAVKEILMKSELSTNTTNIKF